MLNFLSEIGKDFLYAGACILLAILDFIWPEKKINTCGD